MSGEEVLKVLGDIAAADRTSYWITGVLTFVSFLVMRAMLPVKGWSWIFAPAIFWGGLSGIYTARELGIVLLPDRKAHIVASSALGMIAGLIVAMLLVRLVIAVMRVRKPVRRTPVAAPVAFRL